MPKICAADSMCLSLLVFTHYFSKIARSQPAKPARKQNLTRNSYSGSCVFGWLKSRRQTAYRHTITLALSLKYEKIASEIAENCHCRQPHCRLTPPSQVTSVSIRINFISPETRIIGLHFWCWQCGSIFIQIFVVVSESASFLQQSAYWPFKSSKAIDFATDRKGVCDFPLVINSKFGPTLHHFWDTATYWPKIAIFLPHFHFWMNFLSRKLESLGYPSVKISWS